MAMIPIAWSIKSTKKGQLYDYPAWKDLGTVLGTKYNLKLLLKNPPKRNSQNPTHQVISVQLERFLDLNSSNIHGSISVHESVTYKRFALKAFQHSFEDGEKVFSFDMISRPFDLYLNIHGHISIDLSKDKDLKADPLYISSCPAPEIHTSLSQLSSDFQYLFENDAFSDVMLKCGDVKLSAHKSILAARSPVFKAMFENRMKESRAREIGIPDVTPAALKAMLNYIYSAKTVDFTEKLACELLYAADKYELLELKEMCVSYLKGVVSIENVFRILDVAILHDESLKLSACDHIGENFTVLEKTKGWISLKKRKPDLVMEILSWIVKFGK